MEIELLSALGIFAFVSSVTPGPNNLMLMTSAANFGLRRSLPHFLGVVLGFLLMIILVGSGLVSVFAAYPASYDVLRVCSLVYLMVLAWKIASANPRSSTSDGNPLTALQAALFQWVNPKAWAMALTAVTVYAPSQTLSAIGFVALVCFSINAPSVFCWVLLGSRMRLLLDDGVRLRRFNYTMAVLLLLSTYPVIVSTGS